MTRTARWVIGIATGATLALAVVLLAGYAYQNYWLRGAENAVVAAAEALARGNAVPRLQFHDIADRAAISQALASGYRVAGFDNIGLGFRAYEVKLRVASGDQYNFDAYHLEGAWHVSCCTHWTPSELP